MRQLFALLALLTVAACSKSTPPAAKPAGLTNLPPSAENAAAAAAVSRETAEPVEETEPTETVEPSEPIAAQPAAQPGAQPVDPPAAPPAAVSDEEMAARGIALLVEMADIFDADKNDCEKMAVDLNQFFDRNSEAMREIKKWSDGLKPEKKKAFEESHRAEMEELTKRMLPGLMACAKNQSVKAAMQRIPR